MVKPILFKVKYEYQSYTSTYRTDVLVHLLTKGNILVPIYNVWSIGLTAMKNSKINRPNMPTCKAVVSHFCVI